ncbi:MAG: hypothetical protein JO097_18210 [Acidobacteriaceae bacterium]|nr:hypothetical protein [Acidobacteriaceae bacterium]
MRIAILLSTVALAGTALWASKKVVGPSTSASNELVDLIATIWLNEDEIAQKLGEDPGEGIVLLEVRVVPKTDKPMLVSPDDFTLIAHDDGQRSQPFDPSELAGSGALVESVKTADSGKKNVSGMVGFGGFGGGNASPGNPTPKNVTSKMDNKSEGNPNLLKALKAKQMPTKESVEPVEGYLYFRLDGKHKLKNLEVLYRGAAGKLNLEFQH